MDYRLYHLINAFAEHHSWLGHVASSLESWSIPLFALATVGLWPLARPGATRKWKLACGSALASAAVALLANQLIAHIWTRPRPYVAHPDATLFGSPSPDPSFPSDHASAAFAIGVAVLLYDRVIGAVFLAAATLVATGRVVTGVHYPADVLAGALVGAAAALLVAKLGRPLIDRLVRSVERVTDPFMAHLWRHAPAARKPATD